jgi:Ca2+-binding RTX toxin-like protein
LGREVRRPLAIVFVLLALPASAEAGFIPGGATPGACQGGLFSDAVGTLNDDVVGANGKPQRVYGLTGADWLVGSATRATCLFGGQGDDVLTIGKGGGVALGEDGADLLTGSGLDDALSGGPGPDTMAGGAGADVLRGGTGIDGFDGGPGDDLLDSADRRPELVVCGAGNDTAVADGADVLVGCEKRGGVGKLLRHKHLLDEQGGRQSIFRMRFVAPAAAGDGEYRVLLAGPGCWEGLREAASLGAVTAGQETRLGMRPPEGGWCKGSFAGTLVRFPACPEGRACAVPRPVEPLAVLGFTVT